MRAVVITYPGSNCDRDLVRGFELAGFEVERVWHKDTDMPQNVDVVGVPGGFSYGDYLRCGAIAARSAISPAIVAHAEKGGYVLGVCNGFQVLTEMGILPGVLMRNQSLKYICRVVGLRVTTSASPFTSAYGADVVIDVPIAHHDGNYVADTDTLARLAGEDRIAFRYVDNPNGSVDDIAGILSENRRVLGMMPHPERRVEAAQGGTDGAALFRSLLAEMSVA